jgi:hypothetical protein
MPTLLTEISGGFVKALQDRMESVSKENIGARSPLPTPVPLPAVFVYSPSFTFEEVGLGGEGVEVKDEKSEVFSGDGTKQVFSLSGRAQRPLVRVEASLGQLQIENIDYHVDYGRGTITFRTPPPKGAENVSVRYNSAAGSGKTKQIHINAMYNLEAWAANEKQRDDITIDIIKAVALSQDDFASKGLHVKPVEGVDLYSSRDIPAGVHAKRVVYSVESNLQVTIPSARIERVDLRQLPPKK